MTSPPRAHSRHSRSRQIDRMDQPRDSCARSSAPAQGDMVSPPARLFGVRPTKEETSSGPGSIFRVRRCNKKQSSQRGVDRRWHTDVSLVVDDDDDVGDLLSRPYIATPVPLFIPRPVYRHNVPRLVFVSASSPDVAHFLREAQFIMRHQTFNSGNYRGSIVSLRFVPLLHLA